MDENKLGDCFSVLNADQQQDILDGLVEADSGDTIPHSEAVKLFEKWGLK